MRKGIVLSVLCTSLSLFSISENLHIVKLTKDRWQDYKHLRLKALTEVPAYVYGHTVDDELKFSDQDWLNLLEEASREKKRFLLCAQLDNQLVGMVGAEREYCYEKCMHLITITGFYVDSSFQSRGIGTLLMKSMLDLLQQDPDIASVLLWVSPLQESAVRLYRKLGFNIVGTYQRAMRIGSEYYPHYIMEKLFDR